MNLISSCETSSALFFISGGPFTDIAITNRIESSEMKRLQNLGQIKMTFLFVAPQMLAAKQIRRVQERDNDTSVRHFGEPRWCQGFRSSIMGEHGRSPGVPRRVPHPGLPGVTLLPCTQMNQQTMKRYFYCRLIHDWINRTTSAGTRRSRRPNRSIIDVGVSPGPFVSPRQRQKISSRKPKVEKTVRESLFFQEARCVVRSSSNDPPPLSLPPPERKAGGGVEREKRRKKGTEGSKRFPAGLATFENVSNYSTIPFGKRECPILKTKYS